MAHRQDARDLSTARLGPHFEALVAAHARAAGRAGLVARRFVVAGRAIEVRLAGAALEAPLLTALSARAAPEGPADLTVFAFDTASTGEALPELDWHAPGPDGAGRIVAIHEGTTRTLSLVDRETSRAFYWIHDAAAMPSFESGAPLRAVLAWWLADQGRAVLHAAAVGVPAGGVLLAGKGGSGKSTTALACLRAGLLFAGEDYVAVSERPAPHVHALYGSAKLGAEPRVALPGLEAANPGRTGGEKALYFLNATCADRLVDGFPLCAILLPRVAGGTTRLVPATAQDAYDAVLPSSVQQLPGLGRGGVQAFARLARALPVRRLELGTDVDAIPALIRDFITRETSK